MDLEQKDWWQGRHNTGESRRRSITEYFFFHSLTTYNLPRHLHSQLSTSLSVFGDTCTRAVMNPGLSSSELCTSLSVPLCRQLLQYPCVHFTHVFSTRDRCTNARAGSSSGMIEECQTSSSHVHPPSVHRSGLTFVAEHLE